MKKAGYITSLVGLSVYTVLNFIMLLVMIGGGLDKYTYGFLGKSMISTFVISFLIKLAIIGGLWIASVLIKNRLVQMILAIVGAVLSLSAGGVGVAIMVGNILVAVAFGKELSLISFYQKNGTFPWQIQGRLDATKPDVRMQLEMEAAQGLFDN